MRRILCGASFVLVATGLLAGDIHGRVSCAGESDSANAVVYVAKLPAKAFPAPKEHATIDQSNRVFQPHVLAVLAGTTVDFLNSDPYLHNVFAPEACADKFNLGTFRKRGEEVTYVSKGVLRAAPLHRSSGDGRVCRGAAHAVLCGHGRRRLL